MFLPTSPAADMYYTLGTVARYFSILEGSQSGIYTICAEKHIPEFQWRKGKVYILKEGHSTHP